MKNSILKSLLLLTFLFIISIAFAQECEVKNDPITGEKTCSFYNKKKSIRYEYNGGDTIDFFTTFTYTGEHNIAMPQGSELIFKLEDNTILTFKSAIDAAPITKIQSSQYGSTVFTNYTFTFKLTIDQIEKLANSKLVFMRYPSTDGGHLDHKIKGLGKKYGKTFTDGAICISENFNI